MSRTPEKKKVPVLPKTAPPVNEQDSILRAVGMRIKHARMLRALTLKALADEAGWSESMLSKVERGLAAPSLSALHKLASVLGTNVGELTSPQPVVESPVMVAGSRPRITFGARRGHTGISLERLVLPQPGLLLQADVYIIGPKESSEEQISHAGEELGYVLSGSVELCVGDEVYVLGPNDSFHFRSELPHSYRNLGQTEARVIWVNTPPTF
ncbi:cupin domain-containing protein [Verminephrobacter aporrectodeae]|uniref:cupin domain-containing protein n=1 Tax=Verminephrobacter aporrectodeae TaxID=1110389 RepID=UPI0022376B1B|nr:cupin domain-containing protein [Verminephrobacter aporrectodeae]